MSSTAKTLFEKVWEQHVVVDPKGEPTVLYIDLQLLHEVTSPQAFEGLRLAGRKVRRPDRCIATVDHNVPTTIEGRLHILDQIAATQIDALRKNCADFGVELYDVDSREQGIVHVIGPELGITKPGMTIVCGDSHTSTHGAFGALAFGIGTSEVEHVLATQTLPQSKPKTFRIAVEGKLPQGVTAKDIILAIIGKIGTDGATGCVVEYAGSAIRALSMEGRMTICNMSIEAGARAGMIAPDETTFAYLEGRRFSPKGEAWKAAVSEWSKLPSDPGAKFDREMVIDAAALVPYVSWGTNPGMVAPITASVPDPAATKDEQERKGLERALEYMALKPGTPLADVANRSRVHRVVHQFANRRSARGGEDCGGTQGLKSRERDGGAGFAAGEGAGRERGPGQDFQRSRVRLARTGMFDVPGDESRHSCAGRAVRVHQQS